MDEKNILNRIKQLNKKQASLAGLIDAKIVSIRQNRQCNCCKQILVKASRVITASYLLDKKYNIDYTRYYKEGLDKHRANVKFVPVRHWLCLECTERLLRDVKNIKSHNKKEWFETVPFDDIDLSRVDNNTILRILNHAYETGQISASEYQDLEKGIIDEEAFNEAFRNEF